MRRLTIGLPLLLMVLAAASSSLGQGGSTQSKPSAEHVKLASLIGTWTTEGQSQDSPFGPGEKSSGKIVTEWFDGHFAIVRHGQSKGSVTGESRSLDVLAYDPAAKGYTWYGIDNQGSTGLGKGSINGDTLTMVWDMPLNGKIYKVRGMLKGLGTDKFAWSQEYSEDGKTWKAYFHSTDTRTK
jgi:hypothetical protein